MPLSFLFLILLGIVLYWAVTQIIPERRRQSLLRPGLGMGYLANLNEERYQRGLSLLEVDEDLALVAEHKAVHQIRTGHNEDGWDYPDEFDELLGRSLLMEALFSGPVGAMNDRLLRQRDIYDEDWVRCGIGVADGGKGDVVVALILCREAWQPVAEEPRPSLREKLFSQ